MTDRDPEDVYNIYWHSFIPIFFDRINIYLRNHLTSLVAEYELSSSQALYLMALNLKDGLSLLEISRFMDMDPANTNRVIKVLRQKGFIRDDRRNNSRNFKVYLTSRGKDVAEKLTEQNFGWMEKMTSNITREELVFARGVLLKFLRNMDFELTTYLPERRVNPYYAYLHEPPQSWGVEGITKADGSDFDFSYPDEKKALSPSTPQ